jgi:HlyD family secretion protein
MSLHAMNEQTAPHPRPRKRRLRWLPYLAALSLLGLAAWGLRPTPAQVETGAVRLGPLSASVSEEGKTRIRQRYVVSAPVSGYLRRIELKPGAPVQAGRTILAVIDPLPASPLDPRTRAQASARRDTAASQVEKSRANLELARRELSRFEQMAAAKSLSTQDLEAARMRELAASRDLAGAEGSLRQAEAELQATGDNAPIAPVTITAQQDGSVLTVFQESTRAVSQGTPLLSIGDPADLEVVVEMLSRDGAALPPQARVEIEQWGGPKPLEGRVRLVEPAAFTKISALGVEEQRVNVVVDITTPLAERRSLGDNYRVENRVILWECDKVLKAPSSGLFRHGDAWAAYVVREGKATLVPVDVGRSNGREMQVLSGLSEGDLVILYPGDRIQPGQRVVSLKVRD